MAKASRMIKKIRSGGYDHVFSSIYGHESVRAQRERYIETILGFGRYYGEERDISVYSAPGRV